MLSSQIIVSVTFISADNGQLKGPFQLYTHTQMAGDAISTFDIKTCNIAYQMYGYSCLLYIPQASPGDKTFVNIDFRSEGRVTNTQNFIVKELNDTNKIYEVKPLYYGGYLMVISDNNNNNINGYTYTNQGMENRTWGLSSYYNYDNKIYGINTDNTVWAVANGNSVSTNQWTVVFSDELKSFRPFTISKLTTFLQRK
jgi:hypothetical protein